MLEEKAGQFVESILADTVEHGGEILTRGKRFGDATSLIYQNTVLTKVNRNMKNFNSEIFGSVAPAFKFTTEEEIIELANDTPYRLAAYFYGQNYARIWRVAEALEYGMVGINTGMISTAVAPFGGIKESGFGREGSKYGMDDYLEMKYLCWGGIEGK